LASKSDLVVSEKESIDDVTRYLFDSEDKKLTDALIKDYRAVFSQLDEKQLVHLLADKRLTDYKQSLILREVSDSRALATSAWIMHRHQQNHQALTEYSCWTEILAQNNAQLLAETSVKYHTDGRV
jgi:glutamate synthase (NADPH/NADH) large chain